MGTRLSLDQFDRTVADIYQAALDPAHWDAAMAGIINRAAPPRWDIAFLLWERIHPPGGRFVGTIGVSVLTREGYLQAFAGRNPWSEMAHGLAVGSLVHTDSLLAREEFRQSPLYKGFLATWNIDSALVGVVDRAGPERLGLVIPGPDTGPVDELAQAVRRYLPHIQRATRISRKLGEASLRAASAEAALDQTLSATLLIGPDMALLHANSRGQLLAESGFITLREGRVRLCQSAGHAALAALVDGSDASPSIALSIENQSGDLLRVLAMRIQPQVAHTLGGTIEGARVLLVASDPPGLPTQSMAERYAQWFNLTPAEARLAAMLANGDSLEEISASRGVTVNATRFLLRGIFAKTGASRQPQLVALLRDAPAGWIDPPAARQIIAP